MSLYVSRVRCIVSCIVLILPLTVNAFDHTHKLWNDILENNVIVKGPASAVKYNNIKQQPENFKQYLTSLSTVRKSEFDTWNNDQQLAFLINAYNAFTVKIILDNYPVKSIKDIGSFFRSTWEIKFFNILGQESSLDHIEHELIRGADDFSEPRIHFAVVCASTGCPKLQPMAYTEVNLMYLLEDATKHFLSDTSRNRIDLKNNKLQLSSIFKWYSEDFSKAAGSVNQFVAKYLAVDEQQRQVIASKAMDIEYLEYDWSLNDAR